MYPYSLSPKQLNGLVNDFRGQGWDVFYKKDSKKLQNIYDYVFGAHNNRYDPIQGHHFRKSSHQLHCKNLALDTLAQHIEKLMKGKSKNNFSDFESLYDYLRPKQKIKYIGDITIYDAIFRLGFKMGILPHDYVYLHRGAMKGAKKLLKKQKLNYREPITIFPKEVQNLGWLVEPFLCLYKENF